MRIMLSFCSLERIVIANPPFPPSCYDFDSRVGEEPTTWNTGPRAASTPGFGSSSSRKADREVQDQTSQIPAGTTAAEQVTPSQSLISQSPPQTGSQSPVMAQTSSQTPLQTEPIPQTSLSQTPVLAGAFPTPTDMQPSSEEATDSSSVETPTIEPVESESSPEPTNTNTPLALPSPSTLAALKLPQLPSPTDRARAISSNRTRRNWFNRDHMLTAMGAPKPGNEIDPQIASVAPEHTNIDANEGNTINPEISAAPISEPIPAVSTVPLISLGISNEPISAILAIDSISLGGSKHTLLGKMPPPPPPPPPPLLLATSDIDALAIETKATVEPDTKQELEAEQNHESAQEPEPVSKLEPEPREPTPRENTTETSPEPPQVHTTTTTTTTLISAASAISTATTGPTSTTSTATRSHVSAPTMATPSPTYRPSVWKDGILYIKDDHALTITRHSDRSKVFLLITYSGNPEYQYKLRSLLHMCASTLDSQYPEVCWLNSYPLTLYKGEIFQAYRRQREVSKTDVIQKLFDSKDFHEPIPRNVPCERGKVFPRFKIWYFQAEAAIMRGDLTLTPVTGTASYIPAIAPEICLEDLMKYKINQKNVVSKEFIAEGAYGKVYKGMLSNLHYHSLHQLNSCPAQRTPVLPLKIFHWTWTEFLRAMQRPSPKRSEKRFGFTRYYRTLTSAKWSAGRLPSSMTRRVTSHC